MIAFSGSYASGDVNFLLKPLAIADTPVQLKEQLIQSGQKHYSEILTHEALPTEDYLHCFYQAMTHNQERLAGHILALAERIVHARPEGITLVSLLRAGTPIGVLLKHCLKRYYQRDVEHYSISIIRDIGLDLNALQCILQHHTPQSLVFIDGWTGKGVMAKQLAVSLSDFARDYGIYIASELFVVADVAGQADVAATTEDYLIPSCLLNATISGLVSRSIYDAKAVKRGGFHGCVYYEQYKAHDLSNYFIAEILQQMELLQQNRIQSNMAKETLHDASMLQQQAQDFLSNVMQHYKVSHPNYIKPGIGEATRVLLRRHPRVLLLNSADADATQPLRWLAEQKSIPVDILPYSPYQAVALIKEINHD